jgi:hypothetical protein
VSSLPLLTAVVRDRFRNFSAGFKNPVCTSTEHCEGWLRLLERLAAEFVCCSCIADFVSALAGVVHTMVQRADYGRPAPEAPLTRPLDWLKAAGSLVRTSTLLQWMHLVDLAEGLAKVRFANRDAFAALSHFDISDVWEAVVAEPADSPFRKTAAAFISRLLRESNWQDGIPWALLRFALSPDPAAKTLLLRWPQEAVPYLRLLQLPGTDPHRRASVLSCFRNLHVLRGDSDLVLPAGVFHSIVDSPGYRMPSEPDLALEEYGALMHFVLESEELLPHLATQQHL